MLETWVQSLGWEDLLEKGKATHSSTLAGEFHGLYSQWGCKKLDTTERLALNLLLCSGHLFSWVALLTRWWQISITLELAF